MTQQYQQPTGSIGQQSQYGGQMSQQQPPMQSQQTGGQMGTQQFGQQSGSTHQQTHQRVGQQFEQSLTPELNEALESLDRVVEIAEWCADKCIESGPQMADCARLCEDLADLASLNEKMIARDSINGPELAEAFLKVAQHGMPILQQHQQSPHVQETLQAVQQSTDAINKLLDSISGGQQSPTTGIREQVQQQGGQMGEQSMGGQQSGTTGQQSFQQPQSQSYQQPQGQQFSGGQTY
ncbi:MULTISPECIES: hypothetical protein [Halorussus]|uniref:hypothetical protein n=1 Tax=Halorussus TaxID=1070314 RepID=UPI0020A0F00B|nr:hypothetical protein [Halorussus vallis]USZ76282.1 hypothetical protein NGM07_02895 [Halorussus vallis]